MIPSSAHTEDWPDDEVDATHEGIDQFNERMWQTLRAWEAAGDTHPPGTVLTVPVLTVTQTTATVELSPWIHATVRVKQMREAGFGPKHWFALNDYLKPGQRMTVRVTSLDQMVLTAEADFIQLAV